MSPSLAAWYGFHHLGNDSDECGHSPIWLVQWELYVIVFIVLLRRTNSIRPLLWPRATRKEGQYVVNEENLDQLQAATGDSLSLLDREETAPHAARGTRRSSAAAADDEREAERVKAEAARDVVAVNTHRGELGPGHRGRAVLHWKDVLAFHLNHFLRLHGVELCNMMSLVVALVRLNFFSIVYFIFFLNLGTRRRRPSQAVWRLFLLVQSVSILYQYACALGLPPTIDYPWEHSSYSLRAVLRWVYLPLGHAGQAQNLPRAPNAWRGSDVLYADFALLFVSSLLLRVLGKPRASFVRRSALLEAGSALEIALWRRVAYLALPWLCWSMALLALLSRTDVLCLVYLVMGTGMYWNFVQRLLDPELSKKYHRRLQRFAAVIVSVHLVWVLPAVAVVWSSISAPHKLADLWQVR